MSMQMAAAGMRRRSICSVCAVK